MGLKGKYTAHIAVAASAVAISLAAWGATALTDTEAAARPDAGRSATGPEGQAKDPAAGPPPVAKVTVPQSIAHATEAGGKSVNITIDDGPDPKWTPKVLEVLKQHDVKAVFCMVGPRAQEFPELVKRIVADGHRLCDHTTSHDTAMDKKPVAYQKQQILDAKRMIEEAAGGAKVEYYRAPGGAFTPDSRRIAAEAGMRPLGWNVDTKDFEKPGTNAIVGTVKNELSNGPTILFHDGGGDRGQTVEALKQVLPWLKQQGHTFSFPVRTTP
ncbi:MULTISPECIES: polysaccharide deacetylase family protein [Streptomyces]|uniref:Hydrolase n=1 Tax=Streptomyces venezuelae (strain ATCC 10712 / CBS 650.69 / DSM 40230 / JCM 4526 / NBRC 13096 / PD 04745) TaxID=953739 RepID=F2RLY8_STRVP|nr:polysaccharide deacetylase family protein [Streptomyces venezuelae]APE25830.1 hydrolase [Streptomyces venezuelae]QES03165.1 polysaccharide deacetylase family protein [Streptomyces venezuelae ATCC 10712]QES10199.1 polysaccharide deacetylase family protein [Streptomyces venezuelae]CCA60518.1 hydrolase [Streptomyces venezuelae ATCC 10712]